MANITTPRSTYKNQTFESQKVQMALLEDKPNGIFPPEVVERIIFFTNQNENTRLVSWSWNDLTFRDDKKSKQQELKQTIQLITETLFPNEHAQYIADLAEIQAAHHFLTKFLTTRTQTQRLFLISKGFVMGVLRKAPEDFGVAIDIRHMLPEGYKNVILPMPEEGDHRRKTISTRLPDSMKDIFKLAGFNLFHSPIENDDIAIFFTLLQSYHTLLEEGRGTAVHHFVKINKIEFVKLLLADGPISEFFRGYAVEEATKNNNLELVELLQANEPISSRQ
jgi:hypothetical protein